MPEASSAAYARQWRGPIELEVLAADLWRAHDLEGIAAATMGALAGMPGVLRVGFALTEGGGRRLRFTASDRTRADSGGGVDWCHIDAYDDVPLTRVARTGEAVLGALDDLEQLFATFVTAQPDEVRALAALPLPGTGSPVGGFVLYLAEEWSFDAAERRLLEAVAGRTADAVRRVRGAGVGYIHDDEGEHHDEPGRSARTLLDDDPRSAGAARHFLREFMEEAGLPPTMVDNAELCLSELVTNALLHAGGRIELRATVDGSLVVSVRDHGGSVGGQGTSDDDPLRVHGRGLLLVDALAHRWGSERDDRGRTVWFALDLDRSR